ncbi:polysaccharide biosynthesis C-terminal domain-containing protein, partial [Frankia sp. Cpl3]|nr:polysaccharide biosynthesis C-terminal domain-containing protein [Frankia sp. Cpl3]
FGFTGVKAQMTAELLQWMWPSAVFIGLTGLWSSFCNAHQHFFTPTLGTVANGAVVIVAMYLLVPYFGVNGLAIATTLGFVFACVTMIPAMRRFGYEHRISLSFKDDEAMRSMGERVVPILLGAAISQATTFLERGFASSLGDGKMAALGFANTIVQLPMAVFVGAFTLPLFPLLASYVKRGEMTLMKGVLQKGLSYLLILLLPITVG